MTVAGSEHISGQSARRKARKKALDLLFEADVRGVDVSVVRAGRQQWGTGAISEYTVELIDGVVAAQGQIDDLLRTYAEGWQLERMPAVDRTILRIAVYELMFRDDVPDVVAIDEAVSLARELSTDDSPGFINGLLGRLQLLKG